MSACLSVSRSERGIAGLCTHLSIYGLPLRGTGQLLLHSGQTGLRIQSEPFYL